MELEFDTYYHIFNRGNNKEILFREERNYQYFLKLYQRYIVPIADTFAYCLLPNHFHLLVRIKTEDEQTVSNINIDGKPWKLLNPSKQFSNLFNAYAKAFNKAYDRTGSLFQDRFHRKEISSDTYFANLIFFIHFNSQKHRLAGDFRKYPFSSFLDLITNGATFLEREYVMQWFGGKTEFDVFHRNLTQAKLDITGLKDL